jgi:transporter family-2 protein
MSLVYVLLAIAVGSLLPAQAGINATLRVSLEHPLLAAIVNFMVGLALLIVSAMALRVPLPGASLIAHAPWWSWIGCAMGSTLVLCGVLL